MLINFMNITLANKSDLPSILAIYSGARSFMASNGNKDQWGSSWPKEEVLEEDISLSRLFVIRDNDESIIGVFALIEGEDPCYKDIEGSWLNNKEYITIHRLASSFTYKGIFHLVIEYIKNNYPLDIRIDTHKNNTPMIKAILKEGFIYTGIIYVNNDTPHSPRNAYQLER